MHIGEAAVDSGVGETELLVTQSEPEVAKEIGVAGMVA
jgi:hypothetical protein